jgi:predicted amidophosphoribosyltransferase
MNIPPIYTVQMFLIEKYGSPFRPRVAEMQSRDIRRLAQWVKRKLAEGWQTSTDVKENQNMLRAVSRKRGLPPVFDHADIANKKSGYSMKPMRKPVRDYKMPRSVRNNGTPTGNVHVKAPGYNVVYGGK